MNKKIQPKLKETKFKCASCGSEFTIMSTQKAANVSLDVCSNCHPFYKGHSVDQKVKGRAEKLSKKFSVGINNINTKAPKKVQKERKSNKKTIDLNDLETPVEK